jgi:ankyrin repeat protein
MTDPQDGPVLTPLYHASMANDLEEVRRLLEAGADPNDGESIPHAAQMNHRDVLDLLKARGGDFSGRHQDWDNTPLYFLCGHSDDEGGAAAWHKGIAYLLAHGADPNVTSYACEETPLHQIAKSGRNAATARLLLDHGADPAAVSAEARTPYAWAVRSGNTVVATMLEERGAAAGASTEDEFFGGCALGDEQRAREWIAREPRLRDLLAVEMGGVGTPLHWAAWNGRPAAVRAFLALGADPNVRDSEHGSSPLGWAGHGSRCCRKADADYCEVVDLLVGAGATREASINSSGEPAESLASPPVAARITTAL